MVLQLGESMVCKAIGKNPDGSISQLTFILLTVGRHAREKNICTLTPLPGM